QKTKKKSKKRLKDEDDSKRKRKKNKVFDEDDDDDYDDDDEQEQRRKRKKDGKRRRKDEDDEDDDEQKRNKRSKSLRKGLTSKSIKQMKKKKEQKLKKRMQDKKERLDKSMKELKYLEDEDNDDDEDDQDGKETKLLSGNSRLSGKKIVNIKSKEQQALLGCIRKEVEDQKWEDKLLQEETYLQSQHDQIPTPIEPRDFINMTIGLVLCLVINIVQIVLVAFFITEYSNQDTDIVLSGLRIPTLMQIQHFVLRAIYNYSCVETIYPVNFPFVSNPIWQDDSHVSTDRRLVLNLAFRAVTYFNQLHSDVHYGTNPDTLTGDSLVDKLHSSHLSPKENADLLLKQADCYLTNTSCEDAAPNRLFQIDPPIYGLSELISRMRLYVNDIALQDPSKFTEKTNEIRFLISAIRNDLKDGVDQLSEKITENAITLVNDSSDVMIIVAIVSCVVLIGTMLFNSIPWGNHMQGLSDRSHRLLELMPIDESEREMVLLPSMRTGYSKFDQNRKNIIVAGQDLIDAMKMKEDMETIFQTVNMLIVTTLHTFTYEEKEMEDREYEEDKQKKHIEEHILLRQRLTTLGDHLRSETGKTAAVQNVVKKTLKRLFDKHFIETDQAFVEQCIKMEERDTINQRGLDEQVKQKEEEDEEEEGNRKNKMKRKQKDEEEEDDKEERRQKQRSGQKTNRSDNKDQVTSSRRDKGKK
ncbi:MAG: hypothetical protein EZS28_030630, partial [Streblomastix strix]